MAQTAQDFVRWKRIEAMTTPRLRSHGRLLEHFGIDPLEFFDCHNDGEILAILQWIDFREIGATRLFAIFGNQPPAVNRVLEVRADVVLVDCDGVPLALLFLPMLVACGKEQTGDFFVRLPFELPAVHVTPEGMHRRWDDLEAIVMRFVFHPHHLECG
ncbi:MAG TPA: hypothetical protein VJB82_01530 [Candidatus Peribacterales bacterium]|nr:hypothetical protein [Candidatus Peribacterales bacterium]